MLHGPLDVVIWLPAVLSVRVERGVAVDVVVVATSTDALRFRCPHAVTFVDKIRTALEPPTPRISDPKEYAMTRGFADLHCHQFAHLGFGGRVIWGEPSGDPDQHLTSCEPAHGPGGLGDVVGTLVRSAYGHVGLGHGVKGSPEFDGWPRWDSVTHQSMHADWLYRAVEGGLRLIVVHAVNNEPMTRLVHRDPGRTENDMEAVDLQLDAALAMQAHVDTRSGGDGKGWYRIVGTPDEADNVMAAGKLAVVLGIEVDYLFNCHSEADLTPDRLRQELDRYQAKGVRHLFPIHFGDNGFGGAAFQLGLERDAGGGLVSPRNPIGTLDFYRIDTEDAGNISAGVRTYDYRGNRRNVRGLTELGKTLIREMIARRMIIDVDHMSRRSRSDTLLLCEEAGYSGVVSGHVGFIEIAHHDKRHEGNLLPSDVDWVRRLGGMIAPIVRQGRIDEIDTWRGSTTTVVEHTNGNTASSFAQAYLYAAEKMRGGPVGLGTDLNGFAGLPGPRFGPNAGHGGQRGPAPTARVDYPFTAAATGATLDRSVIGQQTFDINIDGLAHVGMLPDLVAELQALGLSAQDLEPLLNSAQGYVDLWRRAHTPAPSEPTACAALRDRLNGAVRRIRLLLDERSGLNPRDPDDRQRITEINGELTTVRRAAIADRRTAVSHDCHRIPDTIP